jgi:hypothetical protein
VTGVDGKQARTVRVALTHPKALAHARAWRLEGGAAPAWSAVTAEVVQGTVTLALPYLSVTVLEVTP